MRHNIFTYSKNLNTIKIMFSIQTEKGKMMFRELCRVLELNPNEVGTLEIKVTDKTEDDPKKLPTIITKTPIVKPHDTTIETDDADGYKRAVPDRGIRYKKNYGEKIKKPYRPIDIWREIETEFEGYEVTIQTVMDRIEQDWPDLCYRGYRSNISKLLNRASWGLQKDLQCKVKRVFTGTYYIYK